MAATLTKDLRKKYGKRNIEVRKGDEVMIMRGKFKKRVGKVIDVDLNNNKISLDAIQNIKRDGSKTAMWFYPSKVMIKELNLEDKRRIKSKEKITENK
jgi:large subunit ribosomal protein L24